MDSPDAGSGSPASDERGGGPASERMAVLKMLEQGKITAAEAADLLRALRETADEEDADRAGPSDWVEQTARRTAERAQRVAARGRRHAEFWARHADEIAARAAEQASRAAEHIGDNVGRILSGLPDYVDRAARAGWGAWGPGFRFEETVEGTLEGEDGPAGLDLEGWNGALRLHATEGNRVRLLLRKTVHAATEDEARAVAEAVTAVVHGRQVSVHRREGAPSWPGGLSLEAFLPRQGVWGGVVRTGNSGIEADGLALRGLRLETSNGRVGLSACTGEDVTVVTSNGRIDAEGLHGQVELRTTNGSIAIAPPAAEGEADLSAVTSNGAIEVLLPGGVALDVDATTSNGRIDTAGLGGDAPEVRGSGRTELHWRSPGWDEAEARVRLSLRTSNGAIRFR